MGTRWLGSLTAMALALTLGCVYSPTGPGILYMDVKGPLTTSTAEEASRRGEACASTVFVLFAFGDASIERAKRNGGIRKVATVDHHSQNVIGFGKFCTIVTGE